MLERTGESLRQLNGTSVVDLKLEVTESGDASLLDPAAVDEGAAAAPSGAIVPSPGSSDYGVPRCTLRDLLRGIQSKVQIQIYEHWLEKRRKDVSERPSFPSPPL